MRTLSSAARQAIFAPHTGEAFIILLEVSHATLPATIRVCSAGEDMTVDGVLYQAFPFELAMPPESEDRPPQVELRICNVDRSIVQAVRGATGDPISVRMAVVLASSPTAIEAGWFPFSLRNAEYDALVVQGTLVYEDILNEPYPVGTFSPSRFPALF